MGLGAGGASALEDDTASSAYYWFVHWVSVGNLDAAARQFADDAVVVVSPACPIQLPCIGHTAIRYRYLKWIARHASALPIVDQRLEGSTFYAHDRLSYRSVATRDGDWRSNRYAFRLLEGRIESLSFGRKQGEAASMLGCIARSAQRWTKYCDEPVGSGSTVMSGDQ